MSEPISGRTVNRKGFVDWLIGTSVGGFLVAVLYPVTRYLIPPAVAESSASSAVVPFQPADLPPNSGRIFKFGNRPGILIKTPTGELRAFSARCTHLDCTVQYRDDLAHIWCACHNGQFDLNGINVSGPPPKPLEAYDVAVRGSEIIVRRRS
jgi:Rieske Fe-S protein